jgi:hypothetical protein
METIRPFLFFALGLMGILSVVLLAGIGAAGNMRGAKRYVKTWLKHVGALVLVAVLVSASVRGCIMLSP